MANETKATADPKVKYRLKGGKSSMTVMLPSGASQLVTNEDLLKNERLISVLKKRKLLDSICETF